MIIRLLLATGLLFLTLLSPAEAQSDRPTLRVPWAPIVGLYEERQTGLTGLFADLANAVAARAGFDIDYVRVADPPSVLRALAQGEADMLAGVARLPILEDRVAFSDTIGSTAVYLFVRSDEALGLTREDLAGRRIGVVPNTVADSATNGLQGVIEPHATLGGAFAALLARQVDAVSAVHKAGLDFLQAAQIENRVRIIEPPLQEQPHFVALNPEFDDLMPAINQALADMRADGALDVLLRRWNFTPINELSDALTVGVLNFPPYTVVGDDGSYSGFSVELIRLLAERGGLSLQFTEIDLPSWSEGPRIGTFDLLPVRSVTDAEKGTFIFSSPVETIVYATFVRAEDADSAFVPQDGNLGLISSSPLRATISQELGVTLTLVDDLEHGLRLLRERVIDGLNFPRSAVLTHLEQNGLTDQFIEISSPRFTNDLGIVARPGLSETITRFNVLISGFIGSQEYRDLHSEWFDEAEFWTRGRIAALLYGTLALAILGVLAFIIQILKARKRADQLRLAEKSARNRLATVLNSTSQAIFGFGQNQELALANPAGRRLIGAEEDDASLTWPASAEFVPLNSGNPLDFGPKDSFTNTNEVLGELCRFRLSPNAPPKYVRVTVDRVHAKTSDLEAIMIVENDHENELNRQKLERSQRLSSLGILVGGLAHDFNNTLGSILLNAQLGDVRPKDHKLLFDRIITAVKSGQELTSRLLSFSRTRTATGSKIDVADSLAKLRVLAEPAVTEATTLVMPDVTPNLQIRCDEGELENALLNLILNARDAIQASGTGDFIAVNVRTYGSDALDASDAHPVPIVEISVSDNGPGMSEEVKLKAVDPFFTTKDSSGGTGLGLATVDAFAARMSGSMSIYSELGRGTTVRLHLPAEITDDVEMPLGDEKIWTGSGQRILLVEDQQKLREPMEELLSELGYEVVAVESGLIAKERLNSGETFDLVLSDIVMPGGVSGIDLAEMIKDVFPNLPIVLMTGYADIVVNLPSKLDLIVLQKPVPAAELTGAIAHALSFSQAR